MTESTHVSRKEIEEGEGTDSDSGSDGSDKIAEYIYAFLTM